MATKHMDMHTDLSPHHQVSPLAAGHSRHPADCVPANTAGTQRFLLRRDSCCLDGVSIRRDCVPIGSTTICMAGTCRATKQVSTAPCLIKAQAL